MSESRTIKVNPLTRVEGEASLRIQTEGLQITDLQLNIFEAPRFFEALLRGRSYREAPDITARICGICPVAYQMSTVHAIEAAFGTTISEPIRLLRRLLYCGEWIASHGLHIFMLHAPDFLGYPDAMTMARDHRIRLESGLRLKKLGNRIMALIGGREIHPINVKVGGFYAFPLRRELRELRDELLWAREAAAETLRWVAGFRFPAVHLDYVLVALAGQDYPFNEGVIASNRGLVIPASDFETHFVEEQVPHSTALHARYQGYDSYLTGPLARLQLNFERLAPSVQEAARAVGFEPPCRNPYQTILARALEIMQAIEESLRIIDGWQDGEAPSAAVHPRSAVGHAATEAPRGLLYHRYQLNDAGDILDAKIIPPTSQNQRRMEEDLRILLTPDLAESEANLAALAERIIRNHDPCISCATHFLRFQLDRGDSHENS